jgi:hypothetical protein
LEAAVSGVSKHVLMATAWRVMVRAGVTVSSPGGAGHALLFRDHVVMKKDFKVGGLAEALACSQCSSSAPFTSTCFNLFDRGFRIMRTA